MSCCTVYYDYGCLGSCGTLSTGYTATVTGDYTIMVEGSYAFDVSGTIGEELEIDTSNFNEDGMAKFQIYDPTGTLVEITVDEIDYTCFKAKVGIQYNVTTSATVTDECCPPVIIEVEGESSYTLTAAQWADFGDIPSIDVFVKDGGVYTVIAVNWIPDSMPSPTTITVNLGSIPADPWYIRLK